MTIKSIMAALLLGAVALLAACEQQGTGSTGSHGEAESELFKLAHMNGCIECHTVSATTVGPSWQAIADRYKDAPREETRILLIDSVKNGSKGKWLTWKGGDGMPPLGRRVSQDHIERLVDFILSLTPSK